jgi:hypothetical protein
MEILSLNKGSATISEIINNTTEGDQITSVRLAQQRAEAAKAGRHASMTTDISLMETWLGITQAPEEEAKEE